MQTLERVSVTDLQGSDIFGGVSDGSLERIVPFCKRRVYQPGEYCARQGEAIDEVFIVNEGEVAVEMQIAVPPYTHTVVVATLQRGNVCAWSALVPPHLLTASIRCIGKTAMVGIPAFELERIFEANPVIGSRVMKNLAAVISSRLRESHTQLARLVAEVIKLGR